MASRLAFCIAIVLIFLWSVADAFVYSPPKIFNVVNYGARADGNTDDSQAFLRAWSDACQWKGSSTVLIPGGTYMLHSITFSGPCLAEMTFFMRGTLKAPTIPALFFTDTWIGFHSVDNLTVTGSGYLDGQGASAWHYNDCFKNSQCLPLPSSLRFDFIRNSKIQYLSSINSKKVHINLFACNNIDISYVRVSAPENSPNTDGIHIGASTNIKISRVSIGTGDDCISMVSGSQNIDISEVICGPGHGISIGSLGKGSQNQNVMGISVRNATFWNTENGVRIKTWSPSWSSLASNISFQNIIMKNVGNPIIIDQKYCPHCPPSGGESVSKVQIRDVEFNDISGTSSSKVALSLQCSKLVPCQNVKLVDIDLAYKGLGVLAIASCSNVIGTSYGIQNPGGCL
ncbi:exopolygalacturonase-like [Coffea eugenioides]|uniref:exopolygalacturonase-like n=1 Tax=Coffea eugenioides TaxID=49369 RepID=UPI000F606E35|nr:exopolygalacturonase-like [Coffea eugenioides]